MDKKQAQMKQQITIMLSKKDYYDILGIQKTATQTQIKKSYKKLALRFHPDKNNIQGSKQVFKKVSNAYSTLINPQKKQHYDRYGPQQQRQAQQQHRRQYYYQNNQDQQFDQFDQIFRAFFRGMGGVRMQNRHYYHQNQHQRQHNANAAHQQQGFGFGYIFVIFFIIYTISPLFKSPQKFSLQISSTYRFKKTTQTLSTPYYVSEQYLSQQKTNPNLKPSIDFQVDQIYLNNLKKTCDKSTTYKRRLQYQAYQYNPGTYRNYYLKEAENVDVNSCRVFNKLNQKNPEYVAKLFRYK